MEKVDFDEYASNYDQILEDQLGNFGDIAYYSEYKVNIFKNLLEMESGRLLEFGCGMGRNIPYFVDKFPGFEVIGQDISESSLSLAKAANPKIAFIQDLESAKESFDVIFISNVYHHIHPDLRDKVTADLYACLRPGGRLIIFEHNPFNPVTRHMVNTCEFDDDAILLKKKETEKLFSKHGFKIDKSAYTLFFPSALKALSFTEKYMKKIPMGAQYYILFAKP
jgi:SAM-dependent methyltransferase